MSEETNSGTATEVSEQVDNSTVTETVPNEEPGNDVSADTEEGQGEVQTDQAETQEATEEDDTDYLPDEQSKVYPPDVLAKYAKRFGYKPEEIEADPRLAQVIRQKIDSDIYLNKLKQQSDQTAETAEATEEEDDQPEQQTQLTPEQQADQKRQAKSQWQSFVRQTVDPEILADGIRDLMLAQCSTDDERKAVSKMSQDQLVKVGEPLAMMGTNLVNTLISNPAIMRGAIEMAYPGMTARWEQGMYGDAWSAVLKSDEKYSELPAYGTEEFKTLKSDIEKKNPWIRAIEKAPIPYSEKVTAISSAVAKIAIGEKVNPVAIAKQGIEKGKEIQKKADRTAKNGNVLGAGKSTGQFDKTRKGNSDIFGDGATEYKNRHGRI